MSRAEAILNRLDHLVKIIGNLADELVFLGGSVVPLLVTDPAAPEARLTDDIDAIVKVSTRLKYNDIERRLHGLGFGPDLSETNPIDCRFIKDELVLDVMPTDSSILGYTNSWYEVALECPIKKQLPSGQIKVVNAPIFICTKFEAYGKRGTLDNKDLEDIIKVIDGRATLLDEILSQRQEVQDFIQNQVKQILSGALRLDFMIQETERIGLVQRTLDSLAKLPLVAAMKAEPLLCSSGFGIHDMNRATREERHDELRNRRSKLLEDWPQFEKVREWLLTNGRKRKTINKAMDSYRWKHLLEEELGHYVSHGIFIAAAMSCGYTFTINDENAFFNLCSPKIGTKEQS